MNEADTCRKFVVPKLQVAGWDNEPYYLSEQRTFTNPKGRIEAVDLDSSYRLLGVRLEGRGAFHRETRRDHLRS